MDNWESMARNLWQLLDDIDTADDWAKGNNTAYRRAVRKYAHMRFYHMLSDGYIIWPKGSTPPGNAFPRHGPGSVPDAPADTHHSGSDRLADRDRLRRNLEQTGAAIDTDRGDMTIWLQENARKLIDAAKIREYAAVKTENEAHAYIRLESERDNLRALLRRVEWEGWGNNGCEAVPACPSCGVEEGLKSRPGYKGTYRQHAPDCELAAALGGGS